ncbi:hypothetical protein [Thermus tengchongensis]|uniref:Helix-turn-helix domain-containing protein n=1 Tax=Thermus tengchongensis TaxID=1214928 RepID=A0ABY2K4S0_9DEIN|nr:hypothetical protein [Thermus tengchongensis]TFU14688.1 hypothetical protein E0489_11750 [Thermus tengchongensis]
MSQLSLPPDMPEDIRRQIEELAQKNPGMAQGLLRLWEAKRKREAGGVSWNETPAKTPQEAPEEGPPSSGTPDRAGLEAAPPQRPTLANTDWREVRRFEWQDLLAKAEAELARWGHWKLLGPLAPMVRLLVAHAIRLGARQDPSREAHVFLAQWELAAMLGVSERTVERWLHDPRYERYRQAARMWIAWETWYTDGEALEKAHAVRGGTLWRVRVRPVFRDRGLKVLAPYLRFPWRDLKEDKAKGKTARVLSAPDSMSGYKEGLLLGQGITLQGVVGAPLATLVQKQNPLLPLYPDTARNLRALLRAASIPSGREGRRRWAQDVATAISAALGDAKSWRFWLRVVWAALKAVLFGGGEGALRVLARVVYMAQEAKDDGFARSPGAYAQGLLRREGYWDLVNPFRAFKVGVVA